MELNIINKLSKELRISSDMVVREYWEMLVLSELSQSPLGQKLVFKGGTALRLSYNSPRFSEDLDFDLTDNISLEEFKGFVDGFLNKYPNTRIKDFAKKYNTYLAKISFQDSGLSRALSVKIEISCRVKREKEYYEPRLLTSSTSQLQVLFNVVKLDYILEEKQDAIKGRRQARDLFDLWYLAQLNREEWKVPEHDFTEVELKRDLNKFLPTHLQDVYKQFVYEN